MRKHRCPGGVKVARFPGMSEVSGSIPVSGPCFLLIFVVFSVYHVFVKHVQRGAPSTAFTPACRCKGGLGFDSSVRTMFSIDLCCIYLVFTMLFIFVKRMYSEAWCSVHGLVHYSFLTLIGRAPPALHLRSYNIVRLCVLIVG